jgi:signal transduction histidine kinase
MALIAHPYLLLRLVYHLRRTPWPVHQLGLAGLIVSWAILIASPTLSPILILPIVAYFVFIEGYATAVMIDRARAIGGVNRRRLSLAAAGSGLLALIIFLAVINSILPLLAGLIAPLLQLLAVLTAISYYLGFASPRWLRQTWQHAELYRFLSEASNRTIVKNPAEILERLCQTTNQFTGSLMSTVALWDEEEKCLKIQAPVSEPTETIAVPAIGEGAIGRAWRNRQPAAAHTSADFGSTKVVQLAAEVGARTLLAIPVTASQTQGVLLAFLQSTPLFVADDLDLLELVAEQSAISLDYVTLLAEQKAVLAQLQASNQELESFSYSVSHDLRSPLRAIDGFSQALLEDCAEQLDKQGKVYLDRVRTNVQRMGELIDDLLTLSRLTRTEMNYEPVGLSTLVQTIAARMQKNEPQRQVEFVIEDNLQVDGDAGLLQVALENLLDNAWKFSGNCPWTRIEFGVLDHEGRDTYFVRDNGAGFDMTYANKLFGAFQRLHSLSEFSGTGIGLATVQRVIHRHGGQVWAEGAPNQGATFYFTL